VSCSIPRIDLRRSSSSSDFPRGIGFDKAVPRQTLPASPPPTRISFGPRSRPPNKTHRVLAWCCSRFQENQPQGPLPMKHRERYKSVQFAPLRSFCMLATLGSFPRPPRRSS